VRTIFLTHKNIMDKHKQSICFCNIKSFCVFRLVLFCLLTFLATGSSANINQTRLDSMALDRYGYGGQDRMRTFFKAITVATPQADLSKVMVINAYVNRVVAYGTDAEVFGLEDYWATPLESVGGGRGDCEDYAIAKYVMLKQLGINDQNLRIQYVLYQEAYRTQIAHMVLLYYPEPGEEPYILDNIDGRVKKAGERTDLAPVYSFNATGIWAGVSNSLVGNATARLSKWRDVIARMKGEGISWETL
jgi:predicted transglutaminase-like cysteine proteinase